MTNLTLTKQGALFMKAATISLLFSLALFFSTTCAFSSSLSELLGELDLKIPKIIVNVADNVKSISSAVILHSDREFSSSYVFANELKFDPVDKNHDGKFNFVQTFDYFLARYGFLDFDNIMYAENLWGKVKRIFDVGVYGQVELIEIVIDTQSALENGDTLAARAIEISGRIQENYYLGLIPENLTETLDNLFFIVNEAAMKAHVGVNIGSDYVHKIEDALEKLKDKISGLLEGGTSPKKMRQTKKDIFCYLEIVKGWYNTGYNSKLITSIERKLAKVKGYNYFHQHAPIIFTSRLKFY